MYGCNCQTKHDNYQCVWNCQDSTLMQKLYNMQHMVGRVFLSLKMRFQTSEEQNSRMSFTMESNP